MAASFISAEAVIWAAGANPAGQSITIPSDCTAVYAFAAHNASQNPIAGTWTLAGNAPGQRGGLLGGSGLKGIGVVAWYDPPTGSQTLDVDWQGITPSAGPVCMVAYVKDGNRRTWRTHDYDHDTGATAVTANLAAITGDLCIKFDVRTDTGEVAPSLSAGWTNGGTTGNVDIGARLSYKTSAAGTDYVLDGGSAGTATDEVIASEDENASAIIGISIPPAGRYLRRMVTADGDGVMSAATDVWVQNGDLCIVGLKQEGASPTQFLTAGVDDSSGLANTFTAATAYQSHTNGDLHTQIVYATVVNQSQTTPGIFVPRVQSTGGTFRWMHYSVWAPDVDTEFDIAPQTSVGATNESGTALTAGSLDAAGPGVAACFYGGYGSYTWTQGSGWTKAVGDGSAAYTQYRELSAAATITGDASHSSAGGATLAHMVFFQDAEAPEPEPGPTLFVVRAPIRTN